jgi:thiamine kinase-like enzyme
MALRLHDPVEQITKLPIWSGAVRVEPLAGGITNANFVATDDAGRYVVRLGDDIPVHHIVRSHEVAVSRAAHAAGVAPKVIYAADGILVLEFIESRTLSEQDVRVDNTLVDIVALVKRCHSQVAEHLRGAALVFWVFHVIRDYARTLRDAHSGHVKTLDILLAAAQRLEQAAGPYEIVFAHNDLLAANFLDDGRRLWLVDWEYAGFNTPLFDLGGLATNNGLSESQEKHMLGQYFEKPPDDHLWLRYQAMKCASLLRETMWSMVSEHYSTIDFDYAAYTAENLRRFDQAYSEVNQ